MAEDSEFGLELMESIEALNSESIISELDNFPDDSSFVGFLEDPATGLLKGLTVGVAVSAGHIALFR